MPRQIGELVEVEEKDGGTVGGIVVAESLGDEGLDDV
jgi:hypothetical protein